MARAAAKRDAVMMQEAFAFERADSRDPVDVAKPREPARARPARAGDDVLRARGAGASPKAPRQQTASQRLPAPRATLVDVPLPTVPGDTVLAAGAPPVGSRRKKPAAAITSPGIAGSETVPSVPTGAEPRNQGRKRGTPTHDSGQRSHPDVPVLASAADDIHPVSRPDGAAAATASLERAAPSSPEVAMQPLQRGAARRGRASGSGRGHKVNGPVARAVAQAPDIVTDGRAAPQRRQRRDAASVDRAEGQDRGRDGRLPASDGPGMTSRPRESAAPAGREPLLGPAFLMYYDDSAKRSMQEKIAAAMAAYEVRFNGTPNLVWVNDAVTPNLQVEHLVIERRITVRPNTIWVGRQPAAAPEEA